MTVLHAPLPAAAPPAPASLAADLAVDFLRTEASWLRWALRRADRGEDVTAFLDRHDETHPTWLAVIAVATRTADRDASKALAALYAYHGRVAAHLERGLDPRLGREAAHQVRVVLAARATELTEACVADVRRISSTG